MKAMIFAAGLGKRLGSITSGKPKALVDIGGKSILRLAVEKLSGEGFDDIIINVHHFAGQVEEEALKLKSEGFGISISDERNLLLETGGGLFKARSFFNDEPFLLYNADIITNLGLRELYSSHISGTALATLAVSDHGHDRVFLFNNDGLMCGWRNRKTGEEIMSRDSCGNLSEYSFSGIHVVSPQIFRFMKEGIYSMTTLYLELAKDNDISMFLHKSSIWIDIGTPSELEKARKILQAISSSKSL